MANYITKINYQGTDCLLKASTLDTTGVAAGLTPRSDGSGSIIWSSQGGGVTGLVSEDVSYSGEINLGTGLKILAGNTMQCDGVSYVASAPLAGNASGLKFAVFTEPPSSINYQVGWLYFILEPNG